MPYADKEKNDKCKHEYYESVKNTDEYKIKTKLATKKWRQENPEAYTKSRILSNWRRRGLILREGETYDMIYDKYLSTTHCELCNVELSTEKKRSSKTKCMDHCHETNYFRNILCHSCNFKR
tara:strand:+ start:315 stop:680 length:366 start_codon:yes stop_codon:yes gene_type:complete